MSLITETLKKMKKETNSSPKQDDEVLAPPALRNAIVNTKKYKEFVKNAELKDINGNKAPLKGFVIFSILILSVIGVTSAVYLSKEDDKMVNKAGIVQPGNMAENNALNNQPKSNNIAVQSPVPSNGRPYNDSSNKIKENNIVKNENMAGSVKAQKEEIVKKNENINKQENIFIETTSVKKPVENNVNEKVNINENKNMPSNIILPNQLFVIPQVENKADNSLKSEKEESSAEKNKQENSLISNNQIDNSATEKQIQVANNNINNSAAVKAEETILEEKQENNVVVKDNNAGLSSINEVKALKTEEKPGTVTASTISLYNQYIATANKAKNKGAYDRAIEYYVNALALNKTDELSANIALMYIKLKNPNMAFQVSVTNGMKDTKLLSQLAVIMVQQKYFLEANKMLQYANTFQRSADVLVATGYLNQMQNNLDEALKYYNEAMAVDVTNNNAVYYAALCYEMQGKNQEAKKLYEKIVNSPNADSKLKTEAKNKLSSL